VPSVTSTAISRPSMRWTSEAAAGSTQRAHTEISGSPRARPRAAADRTPRSQVFSIAGSDGIITKRDVHVRQESEDAVARRSTQGTRREDAGAREAPRVERADR